MESNNVLINPVRFVSYVLVIYRNESVELEF